VTLRGLWAGRPCLQPTRPTRPSAICEGSTPPCAAAFAEGARVSKLLGKGAVEAIEHALEPFEGTVNELLASLPGAAIR
jgi:hypothetical protein